MTVGLYFQGLPPVALLDNEGSALWPNYQCILQSVGVRRFLPAPARTSHKFGDMRSMHPPIIVFAHAPAHFLQIVFQKKKKINCLLLKIMKFKKKIMLCADARTPTHISEHFSAPLAHKSPHLHTCAHVFVCAH